MLFLCGLTYQIVRYDRACTSQGGIALSPWNPLLGRQQYPVRVTWRFLIRAAAYAALSDLEQSSKSSSNAGWLRSAPVSFAEHFRSVCRNVSGKLPSHAFAGLTALSRRAAACAAGKQHQQFCNRLFFGCFLSSCA